MSNKNKITISMTIGVNDVPTLNIVRSIEL